MHKAPELALRPRPDQNRSEQLAERKAAEEDVLLREVDDAVRQDEMLGAFQRYGRPVGAIVVLGLVGLAGYLFWDNSRKEQAGERGESLTVALDRIESGQLQPGDKQLATLARNAGPGTEAAATLMRGGIAAQQGKKPEAVKLFAQVAKNEDAPRAFRELATIREVALTFDNLPPATVVARLKPLAVPGKPWFGSAGELLGIAYLKQGNTKLAGPLFAAISRDEQTPETLRRRSRQMAGLLGVDAIDDAAKTVAAEGQAL